MQHVIQTKLMSHKARGRIHPTNYTTMVKDHLKLIENCIPKSMMNSLLMSIDIKNQQTEKKREKSNQDTTFETQ